MWRRLRRPRPLDEPGGFDVHDHEALAAAVALAGSEATALTMYMCWHEGRGHEYPADVMEAAARLRERHLAESGSHEAYTSLTFAPSTDDLADFVLVAPYCDLAYADNAAGDTVLWVSEDGSFARAGTGGAAEPHGGYGPTC